MKRSALLPMMARVQARLVLEEKQQKTIVSTGAKVNLRRSLRSRRPACSARRRFTLMRNSRKLARRVTKNTLASVWTVSAVCLLLHPSSRHSAPLVGSSREKKHTSDALRVQERRRYICAREKTKSCAWTVKKKSEPKKNTAAKNRNVDDHAQNRIKVFMCTINKKASSCLYAK
jgi:hypothetical protein